MSLLNALNIFPLFNRFTRNTATMFMLHEVLPESECTGDALSTEILRSFCGYLKDNNYSVISLRDFIKALREEEDLYKTVVFTVDDGFEGFYHHAYPILREFDYPATVFLTSDFIEGKLFFWWNRIEYAVAETALNEIDLNDCGIGVLPLTDSKKKEQAVYRITMMCKNLSHEERLSFVDRLASRLEIEYPARPGGKFAPLTWQEIFEIDGDVIDFFPHTKTHPIMSQVSPEQQLVEVTESKTILEKKLNRTLDIFCYPNGGRADFNEDTIAALRKAGYTAAVTAISGFDSTNEENDMFRLHRLAIPPDLARFKRCICGLEYLRAKLR